ncbi:MAG: ABC transporter permease [Candidatus Aminicenantes bacterium]|nr:ABC transporter permease [Candidatus Aminicenantes bacterium]
MSRLRIRELVRKEFIQLFRDKKSRQILIIAPIMQLLIFGYVVTTDIRNITVGFLDQSQTKESRMLIDAFNANKTFNIIYYTEKPKDLEQGLLKRKFDLAIKVGPDFSERIRKKGTAHVQILADGSMSNMASVRIAYSSLVLDRLNQTFIKELYPFRMEYGKIDARIRTWYNPNLYSQDFFVPGIVAFLIMILVMVFTSMSIIKEREEGTMEQLIVTPIKPIELIMGKTIPYVVIALAQMIAVTIFAIFWFRIPLAGSSLLLLFATFLFILSVLGIGLFISTISSTQQQAMMTCFFFILPFIMLSGFVFPIANMPQVVQWLTHLNPLMHFLIIIRGIFLKGVGIEVFWPQFVSLMILGLIIFTGAVRRLKKRLD